MARSSFLYGKTVMIAAFPRCLLTLLLVLFSLGTDGTMCSGIIGKLEGLSTIYEQPGWEEDCLGGVRIYILLSCYTLYVYIIILLYRLLRLLVSLECCLSAKWLRYLKAPQ